jgi:hypothetical protein
MPPHVLRYETPPGRRPAPQNRLIGQTTRHRADENPSGAPMVRSQYRAATPPPPDSPPSAYRNADSAAPRPRPRPAHAPTAETAQPAAPRPPAVHAVPVPRSHQPAYEPRHQDALPHPTLSTCHDHTTSRSPAATCGLRYAPSAPVRWRSRPRRSLHLRPPSAATLASTHADDRRLTVSEPASTIGPDAVLAPRPHRAVAALTERPAHSPRKLTLTCDVRTFFTGIKSARLRRKLAQSAEARFAARLGCTRSRTRTTRSRCALMRRRWCVRWWIAIWRGDNSIVDGVARRVLERSSGGQGGARWWV